MVGGAWVPSMRSILKRIGQMSPARVRRGLNFAGILILLGGLIAPAIIWQAQRDDSNGEDGQLSNPAAPLATSDSRKQSRQVEIYYGKTGLLFERWSEEAAALTHGKGLAKTLAVLSVIAGVTCFLAASRLPA